MLNDLRCPDCAGLLDVDRFEVIGRLYCPTCDRIHSPSDFASPRGNLADDIVDVIMAFLAAGVLANLER